MENKCHPFKYPKCLTCSLYDITGESYEIRNLLKKTGSIINEDLPILITGESGTGKNLLAESIHYALCCKREKNPFIIKSCNGIESDRFFSELLLNHGLDTFASKGTLHIKSIEGASLKMQQGILKMIDEKMLYLNEFPEGTVMNFRVIASTNVDLNKLIEKGQFVKELYYRLNVFNLNLVPLNRRKQDIIPISLNYLGKLALENKVSDYTMSKKLMKLLCQYYWAGNVRELENMLRREVKYLKAGMTVLKNIPKELSVKKKCLNYKAHWSDEPLPQQLNEKKRSRATLKPLWIIEKEAIIVTLKACDNNRNECARILQISRNTLYRKIKKYNI